MTQDSQPAGADRNSERRVTRIITRVRRRVVVRDLVTFGTGRAWLAVVAIGGALLALCLRPRRRTQR